MPRPVTRSGEGAHAQSQPSMIWRQAMTTGAGRIRRPKFLARGVGAVRRSLISEMKGLRLSRELRQGRGGLGGFRAGAS
jgi:hypothetical protein